MNTWRRTHSCGELGAEEVGQTVVLMGWVDVIRDLGGITFLELRDRMGVTQILISPSSGEGVKNTAKRLGSEWVVAVKGEVLRRAEDNINRSVATGEIEVRADGIEVLSEAKTPPFELTDNVKVSEDLRLRYRYLDLRRAPMRRNLEKRSKLGFAAREYLAGQGFNEIETPFLTKSTPEGARDYLVPSRVHKGSFYALPQSPQIFKQLLMISGMERYFQIVRCFRDEDLRSDRQPEFTQIDIEMSFIEASDIYSLVEGLFVHMFRAAEVDADISTPFPKLKYDEAIDRYGSDKPDLRFGCEISDLSDIVRGSGYGIFESILEGGGVVRAIVAKGCAGYSRKDLDNLEVSARALGAKGLGWARWTDSELKSPLARHLGDDRLKQAFETAGGVVGDLLLIIAGERSHASSVLGGLRLELAKREGWIREGDFKFVWVTEFPLLEYSESDERWYSMHHPFTSPYPEDMDLIETDPGSVRALAYDVVANGYELGGGSIRIHNSGVQARIFRALGLSDEESKEKFGFFLEALQYGTPPHGGIALGFDRIAMLAVGGTSLRDVIAFPKTTSALDMMTGSPSDVTPDQLDELGIALKKV